MARKGNGYVAMTATEGVELVTTGRTAHRELRAAAEAIWLIQTGRAAYDGNFAQFADKVLTQSFSQTQGQLSYTSLRGNHIRFDATAPLSEALFVDDIAQPMDNFPHIASIYGGAPLLPATAVEMQYQDHRMRLDFGTTEVSSIT
jgi:hypothetical protein